MAMALSSAFQERLQQMEETRNQRLSLLQAEKELQSKKSLLLTTKIQKIRSMEQRCLVLEQKNAVLNLKILAHKTEIETLEAKYLVAAQQFRELKSEVEEIEESEKQKDRFYESKRYEMEEFRRQVERRVLASRLQVQEMRNSLEELKSCLEELHGNNGYLNNSEIAAAESRKTKLIVAKEDIEKSLAANYQFKAQLHKQLQSILITQNQQRRKPAHSSEKKKKV
ncbi:PREDICTED: cingulin-like protein 1 [Nelumbo nucifera]|uniref:Cingulin-like protein 1 n=1 Tax=Nelumbo nucifera TaxID=4432 RepID=A0A1U8BDW6_NELNU|nr:PREDICTED: cingulin-like protein 1 [Nelumbo nucifera]